MMRFISLILLLAFSAPAHAQGSVANDFDNRAKRNFQRVDVDYLRPDQKLGERSTWFDFRKEKDIGSSIDSTGRQLEQFIAIATLLIAGGAIGYAWWQNRTGGNLFGRRKNKRFVDEALDGQDNILAKAAAGDRIGLRQLSKITDPRVGLHELLVQALVRTAQHNDINLRRSLTTRDVLQKVPADWAHRPTLQALVNKAELVFFGGRDIDAQTFQEILTQARPLFDAKPKTRRGAF